MHMVRAAPRVRFTSAGSKCVVLACMVSFSALLGCGVGPKSEQGDARTPADVASDTSVDTLPTDAMRATDGPSISAGPYVYVGSASEIRIFQLDAGKGLLAPRATVSSGGSYMAWDAGRRFMYATHDGAGGMTAVDAYSIDASTGMLTFVSSVDFATAGSVHVAIHPSGKWIYTAHFRTPDGFVSVLPALANGGVGAPIQTKTTAAEAHQAYVHPSGKFMYVPCREGETTMQYIIGSDGKLTDNPPHPTQPATSTVRIGPRHIHAHPTKSVAYLINEWGGSITTYTLDATSGKMTAIETVPTGLTSQTAENWSAHVLVHPSGDFVFASNRRQNNLATFAVNDNGTLRLVGHATGNGLAAPWDFTLDPTGQILIVANNQGESVSVYEVSQTTGALTWKSNVTTQPSPVFVGALAP